MLIKHLAVHEADIFTCERGRRTWMDTVDWEMDRLLDIADDLHVRTQGRLDPTLLPLMRIWDWRSIRLALPEAMAIKEALELTGWEMAERSPCLIPLPKVGMGLDFGYFAKEYAVDHLARIANRRGITNALIDLGRDIFALGGNDMHAFWHIGIEDGVTPGKCRGGLAVSDPGVSPGISCMKECAMVISSTRGRDGRLETDCAQLR